jgi:deoxyribodipyrimidine photo-lyase
LKKYETERTKNKSTYWMFFELMWRDFFRLTGKKFGNDIFLQTGTKGEDNNKYVVNRELFDKWAAGNTGIPFIDANMRELNETGFMSNRGRQNVASFLVKDLKLNWLLGAEYFESLLIDYDPCSNYGNWNYIAGVGADPREDRYFNIISQAKRYDSAAEYVKYWLPELKDVPCDEVHTIDAVDSTKLSKYKVELGKDYPEAVLNTSHWN